jgi:predicted AAA+ superfamily ATPase
MEHKLRELSSRFPIVTVTGPRQSGKTTLCRATFPHLAYVSLEAPDIRSYALQDPRGFLASHRSGAILDEVQRAPELLSYLQTEVDERPETGRFVLTGSANFALLQSVSQSLAGRTALLNLLPLGLDELRSFGPLPDDLYEVLWRGSYPAIFDRGLEPGDWYRSYTGTYLERDVRQILNVGDLVAFQTFLRLAAGRTAQLLNLSGLGSDSGVTHGTVRSWVSVLEASFVAYRLPPLHSNLNKRIVNTPKLHFYDTGLVCYLLGIRSSDDLRTHPLRGAIFETWVAAEVLKAHCNRGVAPALSFFRNRKGQEVDLVLYRGRDRVAVETKSAQTVAGDFFAGLDTLERFTREEAARPWQKVVVYGGQERQARSRGLVLPWSEIDGFDWAGVEARHRNPNL